MEGNSIRVKFNSSVLQTVRCQCFSVKTEYEVQRHLTPFTVHCIIHMDHNECAVT